MKDVEFLRDYFDRAYQLTDRERDALLYIYGSQIHTGLIAMVEYLRFQNDPVPIKRLRDSLELCKEEIDRTLRILESPGLN